MVCGPSLPVHGDLHSNMYNMVDNQPMAWDSDVRAGRPDGGRKISIEFKSSGAGSVYIGQTFVKCPTRWREVMQYLWSENLTKARSVSRDTQCWEFPQIVTRHIEIFHISHLDSNFTKALSLTPKCDRRQAIASTNADTVLRMHDAPPNLSAYVCT